MKKSIASLILIVLIFAAMLPFYQMAVTQTSFEQKAYTAYNIWFEKPSRVYCINYQTGTLIPAGTEIGDIIVKKNKLSFTIIEDGLKITIAYNQKYHADDMSVETLKERLVTTKTFEALTEGLKSYEIEAIRQGIVIKGMSKKAVLIAFGYPPEHKTPNLDSVQWMFWRNRFAWKTVAFDENGIVSKDVL